MFKTEMQKISDASEKKIDFMKKSPISYVLVSALAGIYLGFGIVLIFSISGPIAASGGGAYLKLIMGSCFGIALSWLFLRGLSCSLEITWFLLLAVLKSGLALGRLYYYLFYALLAIISVRHS